MYPDDLTPDYNQLGDVLSEEQNTYDRTPVAAPPQNVPPPPVPDWGQADELEFQRLRNGRSSVESQMSSGEIHPEDGGPVLARLDARLGPMSARKDATRQKAMDQAHQQAMQQAAAAQSIGIANQGHAMQAFPDLVKPITDPRTGERLGVAMPEGYQFHPAPERTDQTDPQNVVGQGIDYMPIGAGMGIGANPSPPPEVNRPGSHTMEIWNGGQKTVAEYQDGKLVSQQQFDAQGNPVQSQAQQPQSPIDFFTPSERFQMASQAQQDALRAGLRPNTHAFDRFVTEEVHKTAERRMQRINQDAHSQAISTEKQRQEGVAKQATQEKDKERSNRSDSFHRHLADVKKELPKYDADSSLKRPDYLKDYRSMAVEAKNRHDIEEEIMHGAKPGSPEADKEFTDKAVGNANRALSGTGKSPAAAPAPAPLPFGRTEDQLDEATQRATARLPTPEGPPPPGAVEFKADADRLAKIKESGNRQELGVAMKALDRKYGSREDWLLRMDAASGSIQRNPFRGID